MNESKGASMTKAELLAAADALEWGITEPMPGLTKIRERISEFRAQAAAAGASMTEPVFWAHPADLRSQIPAQTKQECHEAEWSHEFTVPLYAHTAPAPAEPVALEKFTDWLCHEIPADTIISNPKWWAPRIWNAALRAQAAAAEAHPAPAPADREIKPVAKVAEVHMSRYTLEWIDGPLSEGTLLYSHPDCYAPASASLRDMTEADFDKAHGIAPAGDLEVRLGEMRESSGRVTWIVNLNRKGGNAFDGYQIYSDTIKGRAEYEAARFKHFLFGGPRPDIFDFETDAPAPAEHTAADGVQRQKELAANITKLYLGEDEPAGVPDVEPVAWCVRYDGPPSYKGIHSDPTMYKPEAEALANRAGLVLVPLVPADALAALQSQLAGAEQANNKQFETINTLRKHTDTQAQKIYGFEQSISLRDAQIAQQAERIAELEAQLEEANKPPTGNAPCARLCEHLALMIQHRRDAERITKLKAKLAEAVDVIADDAYAISFQSMGQYRSTLIRLLREAME